jgi:hypothetical protein
MYVSYYFFKVCGGEEKKPCLGKCGVKNSCTPRGAKCPVTLGVVYDYHKTNKFQLLSCLLQGAQAECGGSPKMCTKIVHNKVVTPLWTTLHTHPESL